ncbi:MAG: MotA/TolQ/ExbB proton channel family protein [Oscillospiraceae bacterium]|nr:MotA/TolQ/ExbB proton channel family protein [Oscillospiraceae bacterium]
MDVLKTMPASGVIVITVILALFVLAVILLFYVRARYHMLERRASGVKSSARGFRAEVLEEYTDAYREYGQDVNTPAIITDVVSDKLSGLLLCERFLNNAVSLFVTLGLFGTFLGLSMSVSSLTELIGLSNNSEWLNIMDSVGGGLISALSGMGVAFYTSLVGAGCAILLTILRTVFSPQYARERLEARLEIWLDNEIAPTLETDSVKDDSELVSRMIDALNGAVAEMQNTLHTAADNYAVTAKASASVYARAIEEQKTHLQNFDGSLEKFSAGVHDFSEVDYNLRGSVERMDVTVRDLSAALREINRRLGGTKQ